MIVLNGDQMREADRRTIEEVGIPGLVLMENAGRAIADLAQELLSGKAAPRVAVFAGKGNNAGDGFVAARHLANKHVDVVIVCVGNPNRLSGDARTNFQICQKLDLPVEVIHDEAALDTITAEPFDLVIDALLGTGLSGPPRGLVRSAIQRINDMPCPILAVDVPSGLMASSADVPGEAVAADYTLTMAAPKFCHMVFPARNYVGKLKVVDIGIPIQVLESVGPYVYLVEGEELILPLRRKDVHKYEVGRVAVVAGSRHYSGAAALCARAAMKIGAGLTILAVPESLHSIMEIKLTEVITRPVAETASGGLGKKALPALEELLEWCDVLAIGPGLGRDPETQAVVLRLLEQCDKPAVVDADALFALAENPDRLTGLLKPNWVLTPHLGEFSRFFKDLDKHTLSFQRLEVAREFAGTHRTHLLLKGAPALLATPEGEVHVNPFVLPALATAGTGDVLTGMIAGLVPQVSSITTAAMVGNYLHGYVAQWALESQTEHSLTAPDLLEAMGPALYRFQKHALERMGLSHDKLVE